MASFPVFDILDLLQNISVWNPASHRPLCAANASLRQPPIRYGLRSTAALTSSFYVQQRVVIDVYVVSALCLIGFVGNALTIAVLRRDRLQDGAGTATNWLLRSLAAVDTVYLVSCLFIQTAKTAHDLTDWFPDSLLYYFPYAEKFIWPVASIVHTMTVWTVLLVTADRYIAVCRPFDTSLRTAKRVKSMFFIVCIAAVLYNVPQFFERQVVENVVDSCTGQVTLKTTTTPLRDNYVYFVVYKTVGNLVFRTVGPMVTLLVLNFLLIRALHAARRRHQQLAASSTATGAVTAAISRSSVSLGVSAAAGRNSSSSSAMASGGRRRTPNRNRENITLMLVVVVSVFIVCQLPDTSLRIAVAVVEQQSNFRSGPVVAAAAARRRSAMFPLPISDSTASPPSSSSLPSLTANVATSSHSSEEFTRYVNSITNLLMALNSAVNFLIYCLVGKKFRRIFVEMFFEGLCCRRCRGDVVDRLRQRSRRDDTTAAVKMLTTVGTTARLSAEPQQSPNVAVLTNNTGTTTTTTTTVTSCRLTPNSASNYRGGVNAVVAEVDFDVVSSEEQATAFALKQGDARCDNICLTDIRVQRAERTSDAFVEEGAHSKSCARAASSAVSPVRFEIPSTENIECAIIVEV